MSNEPQIAIDKVAHVYRPPRGRPVLALDDISLNVQPREAEYWDQAGKNRLKYAAQVVKAVATGTRPKVDQSQHGKARL